MKKLLLFFLIAFSLGCNRQQTYLLTKDPALIGRYQIKEKKWNDSWMGEEPSRELNRVILIPNEIAEDEVIKNTLKFINDKKYQALKRYLNSVASDHQYFSLSKGLFFFYTKNYPQAITTLKTSKTEEIQYLIDLLLADCLFEMSLLTYANRRDYTYYLKKYQSILDSYDLSEDYKELIGNRAIFVRYHQ